MTAPAGERIYKGNSWQLVQSVDATMECASTDVHRMHLNSVVVMRVASRLTLVASDGYMAILNYLEEPPTKTHDQPWHQLAMIDCDAWRKARQWLLSDKSSTVEACISATALRMRRVSDDLTVVLTNQEQFVPLQRFLRQTTKHGARGSRVVTFFDPSYMARIATAVAEHAQAMVGSKTAHNPMTILRRKSGRDMDTSNGCTHPLMIVSDWTTAYLMPIRDEAPMRGTRRWALDAFRPEQSTTSAVHVNGDS